MIATAPFSKSQIKACADAIREKLPVIKILLFGSSARGDTTEGSDADFLIVLPDNHGVERPCFEAKLALAKAKTGVPSDIIVITEQEEMCSASPLIEDALRERLLV